MATVEKTASAKHLMIKVVSNLPDDSTFEDILQELRFERRIQRGLEDIRNGRVISHEEMEKRIESWPD